MRIRLSTAVRSSGSGTAGVVVGVLIGRCPFGWAVSRNVDSSSVISELSGRPG